MIFQKLIDQSVSPKILKQSTIGVFHEKVWFLMFSTSANFTFHIILRKHESAQGRERGMPPALDNLLLQNDTFTKIWKMWYLECFSKNN